MYDNAGEEGNLYFQICTENGSGPFPYTAGLRPWSITEIWGCRLAVLVGNKGTCTSEEHGMRPPAGKYDWISQGTTKPRQITWDKFLISESVGHWFPTSCLWTASLISGDDQKKGNSSIAWAVP